MSQSSRSEWERGSSVASRRSLLAGAAGAIGLVAVDAVARTPMIEANTGDAVLAGHANTAGTATSIRNTGIFDSASTTAVGLIVNGANGNNTDGSTCFAGSTTAGTGLLAVGGTNGGFCANPEVKGGVGLEAHGGAGVGGGGGGVGILAKGGAGAPGGSGLVATAGSGGNADGISSTGSGTGNGVRGNGGGSSGHGVHADGGAPNGPGVVGFAQGTGDGVRGTGGGSSGTGVRGIGGAPNGTGVNGQGAGSGDGVLGTGGPTSGTGVRGDGAGPNGTGVHGEGQGSGAGVLGRGRSGGPGVHGVATSDGAGVLGSALGGGSGVMGTAAFQQGIGVSAENSHGGTALQVTGRADFAGATNFARSGISNVPAGATDVTVSAPGALTAASIVMALLQNGGLGAVQVKVAIPNVSAGTFRIVLNQVVPAGKTAHVGWFIVN
jgi:hypothetical protein